MTVEAGCLRIVGMDEYQTESGQVGYLELFEQRRGETLPLMLPVRGEPAEEHRRQGVGLVARCADGGLCQAMTTVADA